MAKLVYEVPQLCFPQVHVGNPSTPHLHEHPHLVPVPQKLLGILHPINQIVFAYLGGESDFLQFFLMLAGFFLLLALLVFEFAVIHDAAHWGTGVRGNLDQVQPLGARQPNGVASVHDTQLLTVLVNDQHLRNANLFVDPQFVAFFPVRDDRSPPAESLADHK